jgi:serine/threonine protein kinase
MAEIIRAGDFGGPGERRTAVHLQQHLPDDWVVICGKELVSHTGVQEVDFIVIGEHAVFAVEEKYWKGTIQGNQNGWVRAGESQGSPLGQAGMAARRLAGMLKDISYIRQARLGHFVFPRVIMSHPDVELRLTDPRADEQVLRLNGCEKHLLEADRIQAGPDSIRPFRSEIKGSLLKLPGRPAIPQKIGSFEIVESLPPTRFTKVFRARHELGGDRILKLVKKPASLDEATFRAEKAALLREYEVMQKLADTNRVPRVDAAFTWEEDYWVLPTYPIDGRTLRADAAHEPRPDLDRIRDVVLDATAGLAEIHAHDVIHRTINPDRILLSDRDRVRFTDFFIARVAGSPTIVSHVEGLDRPDDPYRAPECVVELGLAEPTSDVYSLVASLLYWITHGEPKGEPPTFPSVASARSNLQQDVAEQLDVLFGGCLVPDERARPSAQELHDDALEILSPPPAPAPASAPEVVAEVSFDPGSMIDGQHRIKRVLGHGGSATTYLAEDTVAEQDVVLKVIRNHEWATRLARNEFKILSRLNHPHVPRVHDVRPSDSPFHIKMEHVRGVPLNEDKARYASLPACLEVAEAVLDALQHVEEQGMIHRDVSPANILVPSDADEAIKLIDFGIAAIDDHQKSAVGTPRYRAPEIDAGGEWSHACDLYSLGVVLYELVSGDLPFATTAEGVPRKGEVVDHETAAQRLGSAAVATVLLRATNPDPSERYRTAAEFGEELRRAVTAPVVEPIGEGERRVNPFVDELRSAYRNTRAGNAGNRGLESEFARETYVQTRLDTELLPALVTGEVRLVVLSGNPGDGKTTFLQQLEAELLDRGAKAIETDEAGWQYEQGGRTFHAVYDASESHGELSADDLLHAALGPVEQGEPYTAAIAANDGRLLEFFSAYGPTYYPTIWGSLREQLEGGEPEDSSIVLVDLKRRSLASLDPTQPSLFSRVLDTFVDARKWATCQSCIARADCPILLSAQSLGDGQLADSARQHLGRMTLAVHLRRERRPTVRDLRSALAYTITGDTSCEEVHAERERGRSALGDQRGVYFARAVEERPERDLLLDEWSELDPALVATPRLDRHLYFHRGDGHVAALSPLFLEGDRRHLPIAIPTAADSEWLRHTKRRYAFEADDVAVAERRLPESADLLPYRHFESFVEALRDPSSIGLLARMLRGISVADGAPPSATEGSLALIAAGAVSRDLQVVKRFDLHEFRIEGGRAEDRYAEGVPDELFLRHQTGASLSITLDLFEFLMRCADGTASSAEEQRAMLEDLVIFKQGLLSAHTDEVVVVEGGRREHRVRVEGQRLVRGRGGAS